METVCCVLLYFLQYRSKDKVVKTCRCLPFGGTIWTWNIFLFSETRRRRRTAGESTEVLRTNFSPNIVWTDVAINITFDFKESVTRWNIWLQHSRLKRLQNESNKIIENGVKTRIRKSRFVDPKLSFSTGNECWRPSSCSRLFRRSRTSPWRRWATASRWVRAWGQP